MKKWADLPAIVQDAVAAQNVLMLELMNREAYDKTIETKKVTFWSRSRNCLWTKGETSGNFLNLVSIQIDYDNGHLPGKGSSRWSYLPQGHRHLLGRGEHPDPYPLPLGLQDFINKRHEEMPEGSYTTSLFKKGVNKMAQKVGEEAIETVIEATNGTDDKLIYESSDLLYHLIVLLTSKGLRIEDVVKELQMRHDPEWDKKRRVAKSKGEMK